MNILLVNLPGSLAGAVRRRLGDRHRVQCWSGSTVAGAPAVPQRPEVVIQHVTEGSDGTATIDAATFGTWNVMTGLRPERYLQLTSMSIFDRYHWSWDVTEEWMPCPSGQPRQLAMHLAEVTSREVSRELPIATQVLRTDPLTAGDPGEGEWLDPEDASEAIAAVLAVQPATGTWRALHLVRGTGKYPLGALAEAPYHFRPKNAGAPRRPEELPTSDSSAEPGPAPAEPLPRAERIAILGGGGPLGAVSVTELHEDHILYVVDSVTKSALRSRLAQSAHAPRLGPIEAPHLFRTADVANLDATVAAANGAESIVNCAVMRADPERAFRVNVLGAYHVMRAAHQLGLRRVVHTGPVLGLPAHPIGTSEDEDVSADSPPRSGANPYFLTKLLARVLIRILARELQIAAPILQFCAFVDPGHPPSGRLHPFAVSWRDAGRAIGAAVRAPSVPTWSPVVNVFAPGPQHRFSADHRWGAFGWAPIDRLDALWRRPTDAASEDTAQSAHRPWATTTRTTTTAIDRGDT